jgi:hypothetical protein
MSACLSFCPMVDLQLASMTPEPTARLGNIGSGTAFL